VHAGRTESRRQKAEGRKQKAESGRQNSFSSVRKRCQPQADEKGDIKHHPLKQKADE
jgi:hypothetical protein